MSAIFLNLGSYVTSIVGAMEDGFFSNKAELDPPFDHHIEDINVGGFHEDRYNLRNDVRQVGDDMKDSLDEYKEKQ